MRNGFCGHAEGREECGWRARVALWPARGGPSGRRMVQLPDGSLEFLNLASERVRLARAVRATGRRLQAGADREGPAPGAPAPGRRGAAAQRARAGAPPAGLPAEAPKAVPRKKRRGRSAGAGRFQLLRNLCCGSVAGANSSLGLPLLLRRR